MLVFGDSTIAMATGQLLERIREDREAARLATGRARQEATVRWLLDSAGLAQGLLDEEFARRNVDGGSALSRAALEWMAAPARCVVDPEGIPPQAPARLEQTLASLRVPEFIEVRIPEGFAHYAVYPELYAEAAKRVAAIDPGPFRVLGIRTIGSALGAVVASVLRDAAWMTVRPTGHPFERVVQPDEEASRALLASNGSYAVVDEGPGLSGSSFDAVARWLESRSVDRRRVWFLPSHPGEPGPKGRPGVRERWRSTRREVVPFDASFFRRSILGSDDALQDISAGAWRSVAFADTEQWPAANATYERVKYLVEDQQGRLLYKFAGLGRLGDAKLERARRLHRLGFTPEPLGLRRGFLIERWLEGRRLSVERTYDRKAFLDFVARYLCALALDPRPGGEGRRGATVRTLLDMARHNAAEALGSGYDRALDPLEAELSDLDEQARPVATDNKMHAWEWLHTPDDAFVKTDALDHHAGHDLVGCQDIAWDLAGASVELGLDDPETGRLIEHLARVASRFVSRRRLRFYRVAYLAFELGRASLGLQAVADPMERERMQRSVGGYRDLLKAAIEDRS
jgi:hypothetical protein